MYPVFTRNTPIYDGQISQWMSGNEEYRAMACNIIYDARVSEERASIFDLQYGSKEKLLEVALRKYKDECVRCGHEPHFTQDLNRDNIVAGAPPDFADPDTPLLTFLDLNSQRRLYQWAHLYSHPDYGYVFDHYNPDRTLNPDDALSDWLGGAIRNFGERTFVKSVLAAARQLRAVVRNANPAATSMRVTINPRWAALSRPRKDLLDLFTCNLSRSLVRNRWRCKGHQPTLDYPSEIHCFRCWNPRSSNNPRRWLVPPTLPIPS